MTPTTAKLGLLLCALIVILHGALIIGLILTAKLLAAGLIVLIESIVLLVVAVLI